MLDRHGNVKLLDLGLSRFKQETPTQELPTQAPLTATGMLMGTCDYMSPEQCRESRDVSIRSDLYSLGCTLYELLCGRPPFAGYGFSSRAEKMAAHMMAPPPPIRDRRPDIPEPLADLVERLLAKDPQDRMATPGELADALAPLAAGSDLVKQARTMLLPPQRNVETVQDVEDTDAIGSQVVGIESQQEPQRVAPVSESRRFSWMPYLIAVALAGFVALGVLLMLQTGKGTLVVEIDDPAVEAKVTSGGLSIKDLKSGRTYAIQPGETPLPTGQYGLVVRDDAGLQVDTPEFTLRRNKKVTVRVSVRQPLARPAVTPIEITPEPIDFPSGAPLTEAALVTKPARIEGVHSWTIESRSLHAEVADMAFSPDGRMLAVAGSSSAMVRIWNADSGELMRVLACHQRDKYESRLRALAWSPDSRLLATGGLSGTEIWEVASGRKLRQWGSPHVESLAWSPDGRILAEATRYGLLLRDPVSGDVVREFKGHEDSVVCVAWSPDGTRLASGGHHNDKRVRFWDAASGQLEHTFEAEGSINDVAWSPDGQVVGVSAVSQTYLLDGATGKPLHEQALQAPAASLSLAWSADGKSLFGGGQGGYRVWARDGRTGEILRGQDLPLSWEWGRVAYSAGNRKFAVAGRMGAVWLWQSVESVFEPDWQQTAQVLSGHVDGGSVSQGARFCEDGKVIARGGRSGNFVRVWATDSGRYIGQVHCTERFALAPNGARLVGGARDDARIARIWNTSSAKQLAEIRTESHIRCFEWSPAGEIIAVGTDERIELRNAASGESLHSIPQSRQWHTIPGSDNALIVFSRDGKTLAAGTGEQIQLIDVETGEPIRTIDTVDGQLKRLAFSPDDKTLAATAEWTVYLFEVESGKQIDQHDGVYGWPLCWYDGGKKLRCGHTDVWDLRSNTVQRGCASAHFTSRNGEISYSPIGGNTYQLRDLSDGKLLRTILPLPREQYAVISPEGHFTGSPGVENELVYVVQTDEGQQTLTPAEFAAKYGWKNDPGRVGFHPGSIDP